MTLSRWLRDYLYISLGGSRSGTLATCRNLMITMVLGGLWHGANLTFLLWGAIHGTALTIEHLLAGRRPKDAPPPSGLRTALAWLVTFHIVCVAWIFFRASSIESAFTYFATMATGGIWTTTMSGFVAALVVLGFATQVRPPDLVARVAARFEAVPAFGKVAVCFAVIYGVAICAPAGVPPFIYFQF